MYEIKSSTHRIDDAKLLDLVSKLKSIREGLASDPAYPEAKRNCHLVGIMIKDLSNWRNREIIPAEITIASDLMQDIAISLENTELAALAWEVEGKLVLEEDVANHNATPEDVPVRDLGEVPGVIFAYYAPQY